MGDRGVFKWQNDTEKYSEEQIEHVLNEIGIEVIGETTTNFLCLCPYHGNKDTPSFSVDKTEGVFLCFNPSCDKSGNIFQLVRALTGKTIFETKRFIERFRGKETISLSEKISKVLDKNESIGNLSDQVLDVMFDNFWENPEAIDYMHNRGFENFTLQKFKVGFSVKQNLIGIPMHDWNGNPVGIIGRAIREKKYKNKTGTPTSKTLFNLHRAKKHGSTVIVVESAMDAMIMDQFGYHNVVALCGGFFTAYHKYLLNRYFDTIIIMTDYDDTEEHKVKDGKQCNKCKDECVGHNPGRALGEKIAKEMNNKRIYWACYDFGVVYPRGAKDPGDLKEDEIKQCLKNVVTDFEYQSWKHSFPELSVL